MKSFAEIQQRIYDIGVSNVCNDEDTEYLPPFKVVRDIGGGEGGGEQVEKILHFLDEEGTSPGIYVRMTGYYASYDGTSWDEGMEDIKQVFAYPKTSTYYKAEDEEKDDFENVNGVSGDEEYTKGELQNEEYNESDDDDDDEEEDD